MGIAAFLDLRIDIDGDLPGTILVAASKARSNKSERISTRLPGISGIRTGARCVLHT